jgi:hypothetical protein
MPRNLKSFIPRGSVPIVLGCIFIAPIFYNRTALDNVMGFVVVGVGICLVFIGLSRLGDGQPIEHESTVPNGSHDHATASTGLSPAKAASPSALSSFFRMLGHASIILTVVGLLYMLFLAPTGSTSGVAVGLGVLVAAAFYGLAALAKS